MHTSTEFRKNRGYFDLDTYMNPSLGCGMILLVDRVLGAPVGHVSAIINSNSTGWVSLFVIDESHRGRGMGRELFKAAYHEFKKKGTKIIGLDAVVEQKETCQYRFAVPKLVHKAVQLT